MKTISISLSKFLSFFGVKSTFSIYQLSDQSARIRSHISEVSDDFFDLTIEDAKVLLRDTRKMQKEMDPDGQVLMTEQMRLAQKEGSG